MAIIQSIHDVSSIRLLAAPVFVLVAVLCGNYKPVAAMQVVAVTEVDHLAAGNNDEQQRASTGNDFIVVSEKTINDGEYHRSIVGGMVFIVLFVGGGALFIYLFLR